MLKILLLPLAFFLLAEQNIMAQAQARPAARKDVVSITTGKLKGVYDPETGLRYFWGIPYAQPPVGNLRWREPQPPKAWKGIREAGQFGPRPMQANIFGDMRFRSDSTSEDCLYLNVWTPASSNGKKLPVLVYFYGGGFVAGDGSEWRYDGAALAQRGIVVVTVNYRLGVFGFFAYPELTKESPHHASGNYGLLDQRAALEWVHQNIAAFGGDPERVTIGGESAGSISVSAQMASPLSRNLIAGAIGESGAMIAPTLPPIPLAAAEQRGVAFAQKLGVHSLKELRDLPAKQLLDAAGKEGIPYFAATIDGYFLPKSPLAIFEDGNQAAVPLLVGWNSAEVPYGAFMVGKMPTPENYRALVTKQFGDRAGEALRLFPGNNQQEVIRSATALASAQFIVFSTWKWAELHRQTGKSTVYRYLFERPRPDEVAATANQTQDSFPPPLKGAGHSWEIEYALGNLTTNKTYAWTPDDHKVSATMLDYFANFIKTGNPNGKTLPQWDGNSAGVPVQVMHINVDSKQKPEDDREQFEFLDKFFLKR